MPAVHFSTAELHWLLMHAREFGPPWLARKLEREHAREHRNGTPLVHRSRAD